MSFSEKLQVLRKEHKMSQEQLADKLNVSRQAVSKWESGASYPEMEKLIEICKIFGCSIDDLTNDNIKELGKNNNTNKNTINNIVDEILYITKKTITMLSNISTKEFMQMIFGLFITLLIILIIKIPVDILYNLVANLFLIAGDFGEFINKIWNVIIYGAYLILSVLLFIYVYKTKYLDNTEEIKKEIVIEKKENNNEKVVEKVIVTNTPSNQKRYALFTILGNIFQIFINMIIILFSIPFIFTLIGLCAAFIISIGLIVKGIIIIGIPFVLLSLISLNVILLYLIIEVIFKKKINVKLFGITFITSIIILGIASGITFFEISSFKIYESNPNLKIEEETHLFDYNDNLKISYSRWDMYANNVEYIADENLTDKVEITINYPSDFYNYEIVEDNDNFIRFYYYSNENIQMKLIEQIVNDLKNKTIYTYRENNDINITIKSSQKNIDKIVSNTEEYFVKKEEDETRQYYESEIDELVNEIDYLANEMEKKDNQIYDYEKQIEEYKYQIQEYQNKINNIKDSIN